MEDLIKIGVLEYAKEAPTNLVDRLPVEWNLEPAGAAQLTLVGWSLRFEAEQERAFNAINSVLASTPHCVALRALCYAMANLIQPQVKTCDDLDFYIWITGDIVRDCVTIPE